MASLGPNAGYILASYAVALAIMAALVWQTVSRYRDARRRFDQSAERSDA
jgi:heme exporter protein CcmD